MAIGSLADVATRWQSAAVLEQVKRASGRGVEAAAVFLTARVKELVSVPAPRKRVQGRKGKSKGLVYYRATVRATPGAPPRKLSGELRRRVGYSMSDDGLTARVGTNLKPYPRVLELKTGHPFLSIALAAWMKELGEIIGREAK